jgi:Concanavalin A-like lectin/glucanases superfamily
MVLLLSGCLPETDPNTALVAAWDFEKPGTDTVPDTSGNGHLARLQGDRDSERWTHGRLELDGGNDAIVVVQLSDRLRATRDGITLAAWTWREESHNVAVVAHGYPDLFFGFHGRQFKWQFTHANGRDMSCYADDSHVADTGRWIHLAATYDGWRAQLYADGKPICSNWTWGAMTMPDLPYTLGGYLDSDNRIVDEMTGRIDDVRIYDRALSQSQIGAVMGEHAPSRTEVNEQPRTLDDADL